MIQVWTINILVMPSRGCTEKSKNGQKHHKTKAPKDQHQGGQKPQKWENILRLQQSRCTIPWSPDTGVDNQHSRHAITWSHRESKIGQKHHRTKAPKDQHQGGQNPQKWENILRLQQSRCTITWSHDTGVDNQHSHHAITWPHREKKMDKSTTKEKPQRIRIKADKTPKMRKHFNTPTIKVYDPMITWYRCGQSTFSSCHHVVAQRKTKLDKSTIGRNPQRIRIKADKTPKNEKIF